MDRHPHYPLDSQPSRHHNQHVPRVHHHPLRVHLSLTYPRYTGSSFAAIGLSRSSLAGASIHFSWPEVSGSITLLSRLSVLNIVGIYVLYFDGVRLCELGPYTGSVYWGMSGNYLSARQ
jgi:hypothetical protein